MQFLRYAVLSAPTSFFDLASLRQAVRLACFLAAASPAAIAAGVIADGFDAVEAPTGAPVVCAGMAAAELTAAKMLRLTATAEMLRHTVSAAVEKIRI